MCERWRKGGIDDAINTKIVRQYEKGGFTFPMGGNATEERRPTSHDLTRKNTNFDKLNRMNHLMDCALQEVTSLVLAGQYDETMRTEINFVNVMFHMFPIHAWI